MTGTEAEDDRPASAATPSCECKVGRVGRRYDLEDLDERLQERRDDGASLRDLERFVNRTLLERELRSVSVDVVGDVASVYETLSGEDASAGERAETRQRLSRAGVDVDELLGAFVSYQTVRSHLRECLEVDTSREGSPTPQDARDTIGWARARSEGIVERTLERLSSADRLTAGDLDVSQVVRVSCSECGVTAPVDRFLDRGGCDCEGPPDPDEPPA